MSRPVGACDDCGTVRWLHGHHLVPRSQGGSDDASNFVHVCANCHEDRHGGSVGGSLRGLNAYTPEAIAKRSETRKRRWASDPEYRARGLAAIRKAIVAAHTPEAEERRAKTREEIGFGGIISAAMKEHWADPEWRVSAQANMRGVKRSAQTRARIAKAKTGVTHSDGTKAQMRQKHREMWQDPEYRERMREANAKQAEALKAKWADPEFRAKMLAARAARTGAS